MKKVCPWKRRGSGLRRVRKFSSELLRKFVTKTFHNYYFFTAKFTKYTFHTHTFTYTLIHTQQKPQLPIFCFIKYIAVLIITASCNANLGRPLHTVDFSIWFSLLYLLRHPFLHRLNSSAILKVGDNAPL